MCIVSFLSGKHRAPEARGAAHRSDRDQEGLPRGGKQDAMGTPADSESGDSMGHRGTRQQAPMVNIGTSGQSDLRRQQ